MTKYLDSESFTIVSADNIDFRHSYARVSKGSKNSSWHGTSIQVVQPLPSLSIQPACTSPVPSTDHDTHELNRKRQAPYSETESPKRRRLHPHKPSQVQSQPHPQEANQGQIHSHEHLSCRDQTGDDNWVYHSVLNFTQSQPTSHIINLPWVFERYREPAHLPQVSEQ